MMVNGMYYRTIWIEESTIRMINQPLIPHRFEIVDAHNLEELVDAINNMTIRGAGAIGAAGGYGIAQAALQAKDNELFDRIELAANKLKKTRPTAQNLFTAIDRVLGITKKESNPEKARIISLEAAERYADMDVLACRKIGENGASLIKNGDRISTHCNAGWLAFVDWGTALSPIYYAVKIERKRIFVYVDETRPRCQGSRLTAWELLHENVPHAIIVDNVTGALMWKGMIDKVIVGADRIAKNGDVANKIGTYSSAVVAKENGVPFYVAAPTSTIDINSPTGESIPIEHRDESETLYMFGKDDRGNLSNVKISPDGCNAINIGFDITPAKYITGIITECGIFPASDEGIALSIRESSE